jgi:ribosomal-protein-serine acetyltransferase
MSLGVFVFQHESARLGKAMVRLILKAGAYLELRQIGEDDAEDLTALIDRNRAHLRKWLPWLENSRTIEDTARFIGRSLEQAADENGLTFGIIARGKLVGVIGQHYLDYQNRKTELGYWLDQRRQGQGIVTAATACVTDYAFRVQDCHRVILHCAFGNAKSRAVAERLGFVHEGILREAEWLYDHYVDLVVYSMLRSDWRFRLPDRLQTT